MTVPVEPTRLIDAVGQDLTGARHLSTRGPGWIAQSFVSRFGSVSAAARALAVPRSTLRGWLAGRTPRQDIRAKTRAALVQTRGQARYDAAYRGDRELAITGVIRVSRDARLRTVRPGRQIPRQVMQGILRAWLKGDDNRAERLLYQAIDKYYQPLQFDQIVGAWFE